MRLSLAMIVKDEATRLGTCLASVQGLVDEVVVLDTGSRDATREVARTFGARVAEHPWQGDFSEARNAAIGHCSGDWILVLDADEAIDALDHAALREAVERPTAEAYLLTVRDYFRHGTAVGINGALEPSQPRGGQGQGFSHKFDYPLVRLFRAIHGPVFEGRIHESLEPYFLRRGLTPQPLDVVIHHYGKVDEAREKAKHQEYTRLAKAQVAANPQDPMAHYNLVQQAVKVEDWEAALASSNAYLALASQVPLVVALGRVRACQGLGRHSEALQTLEAMLRERPDHGVSLDLQGESFARLGRFGEAETAWRRAMACAPAFTLPVLRLARMLAERGRYEDARYVLQQGLERNPLDEALWGERVSLGARHQDPRVVQDAWAALRALPGGGQGLWHRLVVVALLQQGARPQSRGVLDQGLASFPGDPSLLALERHLQE